MSPPKSPLFNTRLQPGASRAQGIQPLQRFLHAGSFGMMFAWTPHISPMLACRGPAFTPGAIAVILGILAAWLATCGLALANAQLIFMMQASQTFKRTHLIFFFLYSASIVGLFGGWFGNTSNWYVLIPFFGIPILVICHFAFLLRMRKQLRQEIMETKQNDALSS